MVGRKSPISEGELVSKHAKIHGVELEQPFDICVGERVEVDLRDGVMTQPGFVGIGVLEP